MDADFLSCIADAQWLRYARSTLASCAAEVEARLASHTQLRPRALVLTWFDPLADACIVGKGYTPHGGGVVRWMIRRDDGHGPVLAAARCPPEDFAPSHALAEFRHTFLALCGGCLFAYRQAVLRRDRLVILRPPNKAKKRSP